MTPSANPSTPELSPVPRQSRLAVPNIEVDKLLADVWTKLNFNDRVEIEEEIHGVRCGAVDETPELIERTLVEFDEKLNARKEQETETDKGLLRNVIRACSLDSSTKAPNETESNSKCYLNDPDVRLRFLRCECFAIDKAVQRMVSFLELTADLFGDYVAERPIQLSDFNTKEEESALQNSRNQYLPFRDRSGRRVLVGVGNCDFHLDLRLRLKILMYLHWVASSDVETQRNGIVIVAWMFDEDGTPREKTWEAGIRHRMQNKHRSYHQKQNASLPVREAGIHQCFRNTPFFLALSAMYVFGLDASHKAIYRKHVGEPTEILYDLMSYGIPSELIPVTPTGKVKTAAQSSWVNGQRAKMRNGNDDSMVESPRTVDVIFKQGPAYKNSPGTLYFREVVKMYCDRHRTATKDEKFQITIEIMETIERRNGRFLDWSRTDEIWIVCKDRNKTRAKIASAIKQQNRQNRHKKGAKQLDMTIANAVAVINEVDGASDAGDNKRSNESSLKDQFHVKRHKTLFCDTSSCKTGGSEGPCFGRNFHPVY